MRKLGEQNYNGHNFYCDASIDAFYCDGMQLLLPSGNGGPFESAFDGRYIRVLMKLTQEKTYVYTDLVAFNFDTEPKQWLSYSQNQFFSLKAGLVNNLLWIKKGSAASHGYRFDPGNNVNDVRFAPGLLAEWDVEWTTATYRRTIDPATGDLGVITSV